MDTHGLDGSLVHTLAHLQRLDLLIRREVFRFRDQRSREHVDFRGLVITDADVDSLLDRPLVTTSRDVPTCSDEEAASHSAIAAADVRIGDAEAAAHVRGDTPRLNHLACTFGLSGFERDVLLVALASELDLKYERLFGYLQDDVTKRRPTVDLVLRLLRPTTAEQFAARGAFLPDGPLLRWELITLHEEPGAPRPVLLARYLKLDERIASYLLGVRALRTMSPHEITLGAHAIDARLLPITVAVQPAMQGLPPAVQQRLSRWARGWTGARRSATAIAPPPVASWEQVAPIVLVHGRYGTGRQATASFLASALGRPCLMLDLANRSWDELELRQIVNAAEREARLDDAIVCWLRADRLLQADSDLEVQHRTFVHALARSRAFTILLAETTWEPGRSLERRPFFRLELPEPTYAERGAQWTSVLDEGTSDLAEHDLRDLAGRFRLTAGQIDDAIERARTLAWTREPERARVTLADVEAACRSQAQHRLHTLARKLVPRYTWDDIVLPPQEIAALRLISSTIRHRPVVYGQWGFDRKLAPSKGVIALFAGPSGTGKTMAAQVIALDLGLDVYRIDLSAVVNKYVGETEKNLERLFSEAEHTDTILFFDEADALFGKRSSVSDAHDRYANVETAYLLQRIEEYDGLVILASNLPKNVDDAFMRRLHFSVAFREPDESERVAIWRRMFPAEAPLADDVDLPLLARKFKLSGGNIRNIGLAAAFLAAEEGGPIAMRHLIDATGQEFQKLGKMRLESDFGIEARPARA